MKKIKLTVLLIAMLMIQSSVIISASSIGSKAVFGDVSDMTTQELIAEMKYAVKAQQSGKYFPQDRIHEIEKQIAANQAKEIERFKDELKKDAEVAKKVEQLKQQAIDKAKEKGEEYWEANKDKIQGQVEDQTRRMLNMSKGEWEANKDKYKQMYEDGKKTYEEKYEGYVEYAQKAYDAYNAYNKAKTDHPEAPEAAQNLVGFLNATGEVLNFAGEKMDKTPLRPIGEILKMYGQATGLGDTAAKNAWAYTHRDGINPNVQSQYSNGLNKINLSDYGLIEKSNLMMHDTNIRILKLPNGEYAVFNEKFELVPGSTGNTLTAEEYNKLEQLYSSFNNGKKDGWPDLTAEQLAKMVRGEKVKVTVNDRIWPLSDEVKEFDSEAVLAIGERHADSTINSDILTSLDRIINGDQGVIDKIIDPFTKWGRRDEIRDMFNKFLEGQEGYESYIHNKEAFLEWIKEIKEANKDLSPEELKKKINELLEQQKNNDDEKEKDKDDKTKDKNKDKTKDDKNPLEENLSNIDPNVEDADASGIKKDNGKPNGKDKNDGDDGESHWTNKTPEDFNGTKDGGFTNIGGTNRPMPGGDSPQSIGIPVLKPNIYLYPEHQDNVRVAFKKPQLLTKSIPEYKNYWEVSVGQDGKIDNKYGFLFYESLADKIFFQKAFGWKLSADTRTEEFEKILDLYKFNRQEKTDFIDFWDSKLDKKTDYIVYPQETEIINMVMPLEISGSPESVYRIWFYFIPDKGDNIVEPPETEIIIRKGFTVVEWGGMFE